MKMQCSSYESVQMHVEVKAGVRGALTTELFRMLKFVFLAMVVA